jgi:hypothetical protein
MKTKQTKGGKKAAMARHSSAELITMQKVFATSGNTIMVHDIEEELIKRRNLEKKQTL